MRLDASLVAIGVTLYTANAGAATLLGGLGGPAGFGSNNIAASDDDSSPAIDLSAAFPNGLRFFGTTYTTAFVNTNGNVALGASVSTFTPYGFPGLNTPMIAPWFADVDTRSGVTSTENRVDWDLSTGQLVATWYRVGYYYSHTDKLDSFQVTLRDRSKDVAPGDFDIEFRYSDCEWTTGDASGGVGGLGGAPAVAGFDSGNGTDALTLPGSRTASILDLCNTTNQAGGEPGLWVMQIRSGTAVDAGSDALGDAPADAVMLDADAGTSDVEEAAADVVSGDATSDGTTDAVSETSGDSADGGVSLDASSDGATGDADASPAEDAIVAASDVLSNDVVSEWASDAPSDTTDGSTDAKDEGADTDAHTSPNDAAASVDAQDAAGTTDAPMVDGAGAASIDGSAADVVAQSDVTARSPEPTDAAMVSASEAGGTDSAEPSNAAGCACTTVRERADVNAWTAWLAFAAYGAVATWRRRRSARRI